MSARRLSGVCALLLALWLAVALINEPAPAAPPVNFDSSQRCASCHAHVFAEWQDSWHARSWDDPDVRALSNDFANTDCIDCHAPRPVFSTGVGSRVLPRSSRRSEGVDCIACHLVRDPDTGEPGVAGTINRPGAACRPRAELDHEVNAGRAEIDLALDIGGASQTGSRRAELDHEADAS